VPEPGSAPARKAEAFLNHRRFRRNAWDYAWVVAAALLDAAAQCWPWAGWLAFFSAVPLVLFLRRGRFFSVWLKLICFFGLSAILTMNWVRHTGPGAIWFLPAIVVYGALFLAVPAAAVSWARRGFPRLLALPAAWMLAEMLERRLLFQLNWSLLGLPLADYPAWSQGAALFGPEWLSFVALSCGVALAGIVKLARGRFLAIVQALGAVALSLGWAALRPEAKSGPHLDVAVIQPAISQKWTRAERPQALARLARLLDDAAWSGPPLIVLPEGALAGITRYDRELAEFARNSVIRTRAAVLFGTLDREGTRFYNAAILITPFNTVTIYHKIHLVPFVEYTPRGLPYAGPTEWLRLSAGSQRTVFDLGSRTRFAALICLEDALPELTRDYGNAGVQLLVAMVNTGDFQGTGEPLQHLRRARLAAIAAGLPMVRAANTGISGVLDSRGRLLKRLPEGQETAAVFRAPLGGVATPYRRMGDWPVVLMLAALLGAVLVLRRRRQRARLNSTALVQT
jgi:apolipoprotein N-acyltransferase